MERAMAIPETVSDAQSLHEFQPRASLPPLFAYLSAAVVILLLCADHCGRVASGGVSDALAFLDRRRQRRLADSRLT
jgi:hypothetical protein